MVLCILNFIKEVEIPPHNNTFGEGSGPIHIRNVTCVGSEAHITDCNYLNGTIITSHQHDVGVQCVQGRFMYTF